MNNTLLVVKDLIRTYLYRDHPVTRTVTSTIEDSRTPSTIEVSRIPSTNKPSREFPASPSLNSVSEILTSEPVPKVLEDTSVEGQKINSEISQIIGSEKPKCSIPSKKQMALITVIIASSAGVAVFLICNILLKKESVLPHQDKLNLLGNSTNDSNSSNNVSNSFENRSNSSGNSTSFLFNNHLNLSLLTNASAMSLQPNISYLPFCESIGSNLSSFLTMDNRTGYLFEWFQEAFRYLLEEDSKPMCNLREFSSLNFTTISFNGNPSEWFVFYFIDLTLTTFNEAIVSGINQVCKKTCESLTPSIFVEATLVFLMNFITGFEEQMRALISIDDTRKEVCDPYFSNISLFLIGNNIKVKEFFEIANATLLNGLTGYCDKETKLFFANNSVA